MRINKSTGSKGDLPWELIQYQEEAFDAYILLRERKRNAGRREKERRGEKRRKGERKREKEKKKKKLIRKENRVSIFTHFLF